MQCYLQQKEKDKTGMYTYTCNKRDKQKPVRTIRSAGHDTEKEN